MKVTLETIEITGTCGYEGKYIRKNAAFFWIVVANCLGALVGIFIGSCFV